MGHIRLGQLPRTRKWRDVAELVAVGADVSQVANATIRAADSAFSFVNNDSGYNQAVWLMTQLGLAAGEKDPLKYLRSQGIDIPDNTSLPGVAAAITQALDNHSESNGGHSAMGERAASPAIRRWLCRHCAKRWSPVLPSFGITLFGVQYLTKEIRLMNRPSFAWCLFYLTNCGYRFLESLWI